MNPNQTARWARLFFVAMLGVLAAQCSKEVALVAMTDDASVAESDVAGPVADSPIAGSDVAVPSGDRPSPTVDAVPSSVCGDGVLQVGEECDDGNTSDFDLCDSRCRNVRFDPPAMMTMAPDGILLPGAACRARATRDGWRSRPPVTLRYRIHLCTGDDGAPPYPLSEVRDAMSRVGATLAPFGVRLTEESVREFSQTNCVVAFEDSAFPNSIVAATPDNVVPVAFVRTITSDGLFTVGGYARFGHALVNAGTADTIIVHELGHYLGLAHTFQCRYGVETSSNCDSAGDFLCDTPADRGPLGTDGIDRCPGDVVLNGSCTNMSCSLVTCPDGARPQADNPMSYYHCRPPRFTPEQQDFIRCTLGNELRRLTEGPCVDECPRAGAAECTASGRARRVCGNTDADRCLEWGTEAACTASEQCVGGACIPAGCAAGGVCDPGEPCRVGTIRCEAGMARCVATGPAARGTACGAGRVCDGAGACGCATGTVLCGGACVAPGRCGGCSDPPEQCNGRDDDCDGVVDEGVTGCGLAVSCRDFAFNTSGGSGVVDVPLPPGETFIPLVEVDAHVTGGEDDGGYRFDHARVGSSFRFTWYTQWGSAGERISGRVCVLGLGTAVGGGFVSDVRVDNGQTDRVLTAGGAPSRFAAAEVTMTFVRSSMTNTDDDFGYASTPGARSGRFSAFDGNGGAYIEGDVVWLSLPTGYRVTRVPFRVTNGQSVPVNVRPQAGAGRVFVFADVTTFRMGGDDDPSYAIGCASASGGTTCTVQVAGGNGGTVLEGFIVQIEGPG